MVAHEWTDAEIAIVRDGLARGESYVEISRRLTMSESMVRRFVKNGGLQNTGTSSPMPTISNTLPQPSPLAGGPSIPEPCVIEYKPFSLDQPGWWGVISDIHIPYHDVRTVTRWVEECKSRNVVGLVLNGDILDFYGLSDFLKDPSMPRTKDEIAKGRQLIEYLRSAFPKIPIIYKKGNHDERLEKYLFGRCPDLAEIEDFQLHSLLRTKENGVEMVADKRVMMLGRLPLIHGHEYRGGGGVMPARWLYLRTGASALCGHFHQPSNYTFRTIEGKEVGMWSTGCACYLSPAYAPLNQWSHGWALVEVSTNRDYAVDNRRLLATGSVV